MYCPCCSQQRGARRISDLQPASDALAVLQDGAVAPEKPPPELQHLLPLVWRQVDCLQDVAVQFCRLLETVLVSTIYSLQ
jgi:hypothetical protein